MGVHVCNPRPGPLSPNCCKGQSSPDYRGEENTDKHQRLSFQIAKSMEDTSILGSSQHVENRVYKVALSLDTSPKYRCLQSDSSYRPEVSGVPRTVSIWWCAEMYRELRKSEKCCTCYCRKIQIRTSRETGRQFRHELVTLCIDVESITNMKSTEALVWSVFVGLHHVMASWRTFGVYFSQLPTYTCCVLKPP